MSVTLKCDGKGCGATGDQMHGIEMIYGFGKPDMKLGGHFCNECWKKHLSGSFEEFRKFCLNLSPEKPDGPSPVPNRMPPLRSAR